MENFYEEDTERYFSVPKTEISNLKSRKAEFTCSVCGKKTRFAKKECHFFYSCDGYDYIDSVTCWRCELADNLERRKKAKEAAKQRRKDIKNLAREMYRLNSGSKNRHVCHEQAKILMSIEPLERVPKFFCRKERLK